MKDDRIEVTLSVPEDTPLAELLSDSFELVEVNRSVTQETSDNSVIESGDFALDKEEPTPSPEANTVKITEFAGQRADEYVVEETGRTVADHNPKYPSTDPVVIGYYPNMGNSDKEFAFPKSRLQRT